MIEDVLLRWDGGAVTHRGAEAPAFERRHNSLINACRKALDDRFVDDVSLVVDCDFDHYIAVDASEFAGRNCGVELDNRQRGTNIWAAHRSA